MAIHYGRYNVVWLWGKLFGFRKKHKGIPPKPIKYGSRIWRHGRGPNYLKSKSMASHTLKVNDPVDNGVECYKFLHKR